MNWTQIEGKWDELRGQARTKWGKLTDQDLEQVKGRRDQLVARLQQRYGEAREWAEQQADDFIASI
ncbi:hypothetical protein DB30_00630 [Enhygromyxa salina]|uniref:CsbD-like domain-containing protein n=1 Tax=Enhygromyxa salina TaxID=215803 RepID=A0A0C2D9V5_9BACT|nr:CsbD family protein [Enhygromyxa salina]KIG18345.1 hypothetical protein DB30_00630 [Enhygromyxa salina]